MSTLMRSLHRAGAAVMLAAAVVGLTAGGVSAQGSALIGSDRPAAMLVYPVVDVNFRATDTYIEIANTNSSDPVNVHCFYVNALGTCATGNVGDPCLVDRDCGSASGRCTPAQCTGTNFAFTLTREQPVGWRASEGLPFLPCDPAGVGIGGSVPACVGGQQNADLDGGARVAATDDPFRGELKCIVVDEEGMPTDGNYLIGRATVIRTSSLPEVQVYSAIGVEAEEGAGDGNEILCLGGASGSSCEEAEYASCPATLLLQHRYDVELDAPGDVATRLTLVPCTEFEAVSRPVPTTVQFLTFNEFEQRMSTSTRLSCYSDLNLSDIDTRAGDSSDNGSSVFALGVQGTITGQTRIRGVGTSETDVGHGILGVATEVRLGEMLTAVSSANLHFVGTRQQPDSVVMPAP